MPDGIPSHDTFGRLFARLDPKEFQTFFTRWVQDFSISLTGRTVAIDGKTLRGSHDRANGQSAIHMVSAWASQANLVPGQLKTDAKSNEITAIPELIKWTGIKSIAMAIRHQDVDGKVSTETSYYISSLENNARTIANAIRNHQGIENSLHWCLNISFREDHSRVRKDHAPENFGILRHMATNLLKQEKSFKGGMQAKRLKATWDNNYLLKILHA